MLRNGEARVFGGTYRTYDGRDCASYVVEWTGTEPPTAIELGGVTYLAVTEPDGKAVRRDG